MRSENYEILDEDDSSRSNRKSISSRGYSFHAIVNSMLILPLVVVVALEHSELLKTNQQYAHDTSYLEERVRFLEKKVVLLSDNTSSAYIVQSLRDLRSDVQDFKNELTNTQQIIYDRLESTTADLDIAVADAKEAINEQVKEVREDMAVYISVTNEHLSAESDFIKYQIAGTFTLLACLISIWHIWGHLRHLGKPSVQRRVLAILWMVPIYSITSWLSLVFSSAESVLSAFRDCYEAYVVYTFMALLIAIVGDDKGVNMAVTVLANHISTERNAALREDQLAAEEEGRAADASKSRRYHEVKPPFSCVDTHSPRSVSAAVLDQCQFVLIKPLLAALPFLIEACGTEYENHSIVTDKHHIDWSSPKLYVLLILNVSVALAFWGLMSFYHATEVILAWCDPWPKFICIKGIVFMTFWQGLAITGMSIMGLVDEKNALAAQNILICIEMLLASIMHHLFFPYQEWEEGYKKSKERNLVQLRDTLALKDFVSDIKGMIYRRAWEGVSQHGVSGGVSPDTRHTVKDTFGEESDEQEDLFDDVNSVHSSVSRGSESRLLLPASQHDVLGVRDDSSHGKIFSDRNQDHTPEDLESSIELIESVLQDVLLDPGDNSSK